MISNYLKLLGAVALMSGLASVAHAQQKSIVGEWANRAEECGSHWTYKIGPKHIYADEFMCEFDTVSRHGNQVKWEGSCNSGNGDEPETALANDVEVGLVLHFVRGGGSIGPLQFCGRR